MCLYYHKNNKDKLQFQYELSTYVTNTRNMALLSYAHACLYIGHLKWPNYRYAIQVHR